MKPRRSTGQRRHNRGERLHRGERLTSAGGILESCEGNKSEEADDGARHAGSEEEDVDVLATKEAGHADGGVLLEGTEDSHEEDGEYAEGEP